MVSTVFKGLVWLAGGTAFLMFLVLGIGLLFGEPLAGGIVVCALALLAVVIYRSVSGQSNLEIGIGAMLLTWCFAALVFTVETFQAAVCNPLYRHILLFCLNLPAIFWMFSWCLGSSRDRLLSNRRGWVAGASMLAGMFAVSFLLEQWIVWSDWFAVLVLGALWWFLPFAGLFAIGGECKPAEILQFAVLTGLALLAFVFPVIAGAFQDWGDIQYGICRLWIFLVLAIHLLLTKARFASKEPGIGPFNLSGSYWLTQRGDKWWKAVNVLLILLMAGLYVGMPLEQKFGLAFRGVTALVLSAYAAGLINIFFLWITMADLDDF